jgi:hypothetical protein
MFGRKQRTQSVPTSSPAVEQDLDADWHGNSFEVDIRSLIIAVYRAKWFLLVVVVVSVLYGGYSLTSFEPVYRAKMIVAPFGGDAGLQLPAGVGAIMSGAGVNLGGKESTKFEQFRILLSSVVLAQRLDAKYGYVRRIFGGYWDEDSKSWIPPTGFRVDLDEFFRGFIKVPKWSPPMTEDLADYIRGSINLQRLANSEIYEISYVSADQEFAVEFLSQVYSEAEEYLKGREVDKVERQIEYVRQKIEQTTVADYRLSLLTVLAGQEKRMMSLSVDLPYLAEYIQPPVASDRQTRPKIMTTLAISAIAGFAIGVVAVLLLHLLLVVLRTRRPAA